MLLYLGLRIEIHRVVPSRRLEGGLTPIETRRPVVLHLADLVEALGHDAFFVAEGWGHDAGVVTDEDTSAPDRREPDTVPASTMKSPLPVPMAWTAWTAWNS